MLRRWIALTSLSLVFVVSCGNPSGSEETRPTDIPEVETPEVPLVPPPELKLQNLSERDWALDYLDGTMDGQYTYRYTGKGVRIYVVDTGIEGDHEELKNRLLPGFSVFSERSALQPGWDSAEDANAHGLHVASLAAGTHVGIAKDARVVPVKAISSSSTAVSQLLVALEWILEQEQAHENGRAVINMSFGLQRSNAEGQSLLEYWLEGGEREGFKGVDDLRVEDLLTQLADEGVVLIAAAGNKSENKATYVREEHYPAYFHFLDALLVVGNLESPTRIHESSMEGEIYAPGTNVWGAWVSHGQYQYKLMYGTSMASPLVAGVAALVLERFPELDAREVIGVLKGSAQQHELSYKSGKKQVSTISVPSVLLDL